LRDYVCGAVLDEETAKFKINFEGETYYFCSASCEKNSNAILRSPSNNLYFMENHSLNLCVHSKNTVVAVNLNYITRGLSAASPNYRLLQCKDFLKI